MSELRPDAVSGSGARREGLDLDAALRRFRALSAKRQDRLIAELLLTRSDELSRAYPGLLAIGHGFRRQRKRRDDCIGDIVRSERCVLFLVGRKWKRSGSPQRRLPSHLYCHEVIRGRRSLIAIPTDVSEARELQANVRLEAVDVAQVIDQGVLTCLVDCELPDGTAVRRALSCRHVLSLSGYQSPEPAGLRISRDGNEIGRSLPIRGSLGPNLATCFDAQAMSITDPVNANACVWTSAWPRGYVRHAGEMDASMWLQLPRDVGAVRVDYRGVWPSLRVTYGNGEHSFVADVGPLVEVELVGNQTTNPGDSGSPLVIGYTKPKLAGMHIAGNPDDGNGHALSYCIPAYALLDTRNFAGADGEIWNLPEH